MQLNKERLAVVKGLKLKAGLGTSTDTMCVMQAVDYVHSGGFSDHPECACPALTSYAITLNDRANNKQRQLFKPLIPKLINTRNGLTKERVGYLVWNSIARVMPILVAATGLKDDARKMRSFKLGQFIEMEDFCNELKPRLKSAMLKTLRAAAYADAATYAADAAADATTAATYAYAYAANAAAYAYAAKGKKYWNGVQAKLWVASFNGFKKACNIKE